MNKIFVYTSFLYDYPKKIMYKVTGSMSVCLYLKILQTAGTIGFPKNNCLESSDIEPITFQCWADALRVMQRTRVFEVTLPSKMTIQHNNIIILIQKQHQIKNRFQSRYENLKYP